MLAANPYAFKSTGKPRPGYEDLFAEWEIYLQNPLLANDSRMGPNPYENDIGSPLPGKISEALNWSRRKELLRRRLLPVSEQIDLWAADQDLNDKWGV